MRCRGMRGEHGRPVKHALLVAAALALLACERATPFTVADPEPLGLAEALLPCRPTFNPGPDESPAALAEVLVYATLPSGRLDRDRCLAYLPPGGGSLLRTWCVGGDVADAVAARDPIPGYPVPVPVDHSPYGGPAWRVPLG